MTSEELEAFLSSDGHKSEETPQTEISAPEVKPQAEPKVIPEVIVETPKKVGALYRKINSAREIANEMWLRIEPFAGPFGRFLKALYRWYVEKVFKRFAYKEVEGKQELANDKAAVTLLSTLGALTAMYFWLIPILFYFGGIFSDGYKYAMADKETLYFSKPVLNASGDFYEVNGCKSTSNCVGGKNARIFDIRDNNWLDVKYYFTKLRGYDPKDDTVASFTAELSKCEVLRYRDKSFKIGTIKLHSEIYSASCSPVVSNGT